MSDHAVKCPVGATMQCVCALYLCAAVMADPGMLLFTSLAQDTYMSLLFRSTSNIHELEWFQWQEILSSFWCPSTKNTSDKAEHSSVKINLKVPYIWCCLGQSQCTGTCSGFFFCDFFFPATFSLLGVGRTSIGLASAACTRVPDSTLCIFTPGVYREPGCYQV